MLISDLRKLYPSPMTSQAHSRMECTPFLRCPHYDVPGVFMRVTDGVHTCFPTLPAFTRCLRRVRPTLTVREARQWTKDICAANDLSDFTAAWALLATVMGEELTGGTDAK